MLGKHSKKLLDLCGESISSRTANVSISDQDFSDFFQEKNGCFAFESALHIFPEKENENAIDLDRINHKDAEWKKHYWHLCTGLYFFAADIFGGLFAFEGSKIVYFDPETGLTEFKAENFEQWCQLILTDYRVETGWPLASAWQKKHGSIPEGQRLIPKKFFVMGGEFSEDNLYQIDIFEGLRLRGDIATQIRNIPDGATAKLVTIK